MIAKVHNNTSPRYALTAVACAAFCSVAQGQLQFDAPVVYPVGSAPSAVIAIDIDGDGDIDLVSANRLTHNVSVMLNAGDGTFGSPAFYPTHNGPEDTGPRALSHADFDSDGDVDIIVVNELIDNVVVMLNDGTGVLSPPVPTAVFRRPTDLEAIDIDDDGDVDFAISHFGTTTGPLAILRNNGSAANIWLGFSEVESYPVQAGSRAIGAGDFDRDNDQDLVVCNRDSGTVSLLLNDGAGIFTIREHLSVPLKPRGVSVQDLDGDGTLDLAVADFSNGRAHFITNRGGIGPTWLGFDPPTSLVGGGLGPHNITYADFDRDGDNDIAMANIRSDNITVFENLGNMQFGIQRLAGGAFSTADVIVSDINSDCSPDIILANSASAGSVSVIIGQSADCFCYADCDLSTGVGILDLFDFLCFQNEFVLARPYACDCDTSTGSGICDLFDFLCFQSLFVQGCP